jgi:hypothetical protein
MKVCGKCKYRFYVLLTGDCPTIQRRTSGPIGFFKCYQTEGVFKSEDVRGLREPLPTGMLLSSCMPWFRRAYINVINEESIN